MNMCNICGQCYLDSDKQICEWYDSSPDKYGFDCEETACPTCKYCCIRHCLSKSKLLRALEIREREYEKAIDNINKKLKRYEKEHIIVTIEIFPK